MAVNHAVTDQSHHVYRVSGEEIVVGFVTVNVTVAEEDKVKAIMEDVLFMNSDISFIAAFQPNGKCSTLSVTKFEPHLSSIL